MIALFLNFGAKDWRVLVTSKSVTVLSINFPEAYQWLNSWFHCLPLVRTGQLQCSVFFSGHLLHVSREKQRSGG